MYQFPSAAHDYAWRQPWCIRFRVGPSTVKAAGAYWTHTRGDANGVV